MWDPKIARKNNLDAPTRMGAAKTGISADSPSPHPERNRIAAGLAHRRVKDQERSKRAYNELSLPITCYAPANLKTLPVVVGSRSVVSRDVCVNPDKVKIMNTTATDTFEALLEKQINACSQLNKILANSKKKGISNFTISYLETRIYLFQEAWAKIEHLNGYLQAARKADKSKEDLPYFQGETMDRTEDVYYDGMDYFRDHLVRLRPSCSSPLANSTMALPATSVSQTKVVKLPRIEIPTFDGDFSKWRPFEARFSSAVVRNKSLSDAVRLEYLLAALKGEALAAVEHLDLVDDSFKIAWDRLKEIYDNERVIVQSLLHRLHSLQPMKRERLDTLKQFTVHYRNTLEALHKLGKTSEDHHLVYFVTRQFDKELASEWNKYLGNSKQYPAYKELEEFMLTQATSVAVMNQPQTPLLTIDNPSDRARPKSSTHVVGETERRRPPCPLCNETHSIRECDIFGRLRPLARYDMVKDLRMCINCLSADHTLANCSSRNVCRDCHGKHHTLLHRGDGTSTGGPRRPARPRYDGADPSAVPSATPTAPSPVQHEELPSTPMEPCNSVASHFAEAVPPVGQPVLLATAIVKVYASDGRSRLARALIDQGSQSSFITTNLVQHLRLKKLRSPISVTGLGGEHASNLDYSAFVRTSTRAFLVRQISQYVPPPINVADYESFSDLALADPTPASNQRIELLLGAELFGEIIRPGIRRSRVGEPIAQNTVFGWILSGSIHKTVSSHPTVAAHHGVSGDPLERALSRFWETETIPASNILTAQASQCEQHFKDTYTRDATGRFIVRLPFNVSVPEDHLGDSFRGAASSLKRLSTKLERNASGRQAYVEFLREYETLGHMSRLDVLDKTRSYIPHRGVIRETSLTTKLRVVFNASHKTSNGSSLNDLLHPGPKLQQDITQIILKWRLAEYVLVADIKKMFRQILVHADDRKYQNILWNNVTMNKFEAYELNTVTYGTTCAPYLSMRVLQELNNLEGSKFPLASPVLEDSVYVDDVFIGAPDKTLLERTRVQVCGLLARGGFHLRKWAGNDPEILQKIPAAKHSHAVDFRSFEDSELKVLGITWNPCEDAFSFNLQRFVARDLQMTKRELISEIARLYDPLGWLSPVVVRAKILLQLQWLEKIDWDDRVSKTTQDTWNSFCIDWSALNAIRVPRWIHYGPDTIDLQLHGFSDASRAAFSCAVYARVVTINGNTHTTLLTAKSRVAPIKTLSIPVLELNGAVMLTELIDHVLKSIRVHVDRINCWTDSTIVLAWLRKHPSTWKTTVANRTSKIHTTLPSAIWRHVPTDSNPADLNSRGVPAEKLLSSTFWTTGPTWLKENEERWPTQQVYETAEGRNEIAAHTTASIEEWDVLLRSSSWPRLVRVFGYVREFVNRTRFKDNAPRSSLTVSNLRDAEGTILRLVQATAFRTEINAFKQTKPVDTRSPLSKLNPFVDSNDLLRVGGRLKHSFLPWDTKHPIILPKHYVSELIIRDAHLHTLHGGTQLTVATTRQNTGFLVSATLRDVLSIGA
ncbi:uncharacterized protein LOC143219738 [Lasioglossum baleicum]|uniref:uncharacterized protein LOC143219738 n=1 Tax=Lasioglossum baleicum TaxID=434251 RepID=UPI003FCDFC26